MIVDVGICDIVESLLCVVAVFEESHVDPTAVKSDRVDGAAGLDEQIDCVRELVLAAVRHLDEVARRVVGLLDDFDDPSYSLVSQTP